MATQSLPPSAFRLPPSPLTAAGLELARQIGNRRGYLKQPFPQTRMLSLAAWQRQRFTVLTDLAELEAEAQTLYGTAAELLHAAGLGPEPARAECLDDIAHGSPIPPQHCRCARCLDTLARQGRAA